MADLEETLQSLLSDPETMGQIQALAGQLGLGGSGPAQEEPQAAAPDPDPSPALDPESLGQMGRLLELFQASRRADPDREVVPWPTLNQACRFSKGRAPRKSKQMEEVRPSASSHSCRVTFRGTPALPSASTRRLAVRLKRASVSSSLYWTP